jgi:TRAP-type mannitol/chloroaromatic compound transport system substrate-binding protein
MDEIGTTHPKRKQAEDGSLQPKRKAIGNGKHTSRREKETMILHELSSTMHTMQRLSNVLEDVVAMTTCQPSTKKSSHEEQAKNVVEKQQALVKELRQWQEILSGDRTEIEAEENP